MGQKTNKSPRKPALEGASLRNAAARLVAANFSSKSRATLPAKSATRLAGYSTVTASGASAAGLDRCAYTLGKWQNNTHPHNTHPQRKSHPQPTKNGSGQINDHLLDFVGKPDLSATKTAAKPATKEAVKEEVISEDTAQHDEKTALVVYLDRLERRCEERQADKQNHSLDVTRAKATRTSDIVTNSAGVISTNDYQGEERRVSDDRREYTLKTLWHCISSPRRSKGRRRSDARYPLLDVFDGSAMFLAVALTVLSLCDAFFTLNILAQGGREVNPVMNYMLGIGTFAFVASKMLLTAVAAIVLTGAGNLKIFNRIRVRSVIATLIGLYAGLIVYELLILSMT